MRIALRTLQALIVQVLFMLVRPLACFMFGVHLNLCMPLAYCMLHKIRSFQNQKETVTTSQDF